MTKILILEFYKKNNLSLDFQILNMQLIKNNRMNNITTSLPLAVDCVVIIANKSKLKYKKPILMGG